jgi:hypothetical protein
MRKTCPLRISEYDSVFPHCFHERYILGPNPQEAARRSRRRRRSLVGNKWLNGCNNRTGVPVPVTDSRDMHCFGLPNVFIKTWKACGVCKDLKHQGDGCVDHYCTFLWIIHVWKSLITWCSRKDTFTLGLMACWPMRRADIPLEKIGFMRGGWIWHLIFRSRSLLMVPLEGCLLPA